jgi:hypothetical protein
LGKFPDNENLGQYWSEITPRMITLVLITATPTGTYGDRECRAPASFEGRIMPENHSLPDHVNAKIQRPLCPRCQSYMMLARIAPARFGFDFRTFECPRCDHVREEMAATAAFGSSFTPAA